MVAQPSGTVSFFFSDIEGSTRLLQALGQERWAEHLEAHRELLRHCFAAEGGYEVECQGDSCFAAFASASAAAAAAAAATRALAEQSWPEAAPLRVRIGIHTGEPLLAPPDYVGVDVHRAARIMAAGHGGQVLVSEPSRRLLDERFALRDLGEHRLKDLRAPERLYQLLVPGLPQDFPPLRTLEGRRTNLPMPISDFIGRRRELAEVVALVRSGRRLVTLTGVGGVGKTRLGWRAAAELVDEFPDGVVHVSLSALREPELVLPEIARALELLEGEAPPPDEHTLGGAIGERKLLLLLDSFDRVRAAATSVVSLLAACPRLSVLATTRASLGVEGEVVYPVPPLDAADARDLLVSRAHAHGAALETADPALTAIVDRVDRLPLALELAAARLRLLRPAELATKIEEAVFESGRLEYAPTRQQTIRSMIDWSYELMSTEEQRLFARLAVFSGPAPLAALEQVCGGDLETLGLLLDAGFLRRFECVDGVARYILPAIVRSYASECLARSGEQAAVARTHACYYRDYARSLVAGGAGAGHEDEQGNFWSAFEWAQAAEPALAEELATGLAALFRSRGQLAEERSLVASIERLRPTAAAETEPAPELGRGLELLAAGEHAAAARALEQAAAEARGAGDERVSARAGIHLALAELGRGQHGRALRALLGALRLLESAGEPELAGGCFEGFAAVAAAAGEQVHAARMQGAAAALAPATEPVLAALRRATADALAAALGDEAYRAARAAGAVLPFSEAAAEARAGRVLA